jgi:hypothetical protein
VQPEYGATIKLLRAKPCKKCVIMSLHYESTSSPRTTDYQLAKVLHSSLSDKQNSCFAIAILMPGIAPPSFLLGELNWQTYASTYCAV